MQDYTIKYGEDAFRAALGGHMPYFQAQFQKRYGNRKGGGGAAGGSSLNVDPQAVQMMNNGKSKAAMIPVELTTEGDDNKPSTQPIKLAVVASTTESGGGSQYNSGVVVEINTKRGGDGGSQYNSGGGGASI